MDNILAVVLLVVMVLGGAIGCGIKAVLGIEQRRFLPKKLVDELSKMKNESDRVI